MISVAVCDDAKTLVESMEKMLLQYSQQICEEVRVFKYYSGNDLLEDYNGNYDIIFLDIKMPGITGIETAEKIRRKDNKVTLIFLTSLLNRAVDGYKVKAMNYIIKPIGYKRLKLELELWRSENRNKVEPFITVNNDTGSYKILLKSVSYIETYNRNLLIHTEKESIVCYKKLKNMEFELSEFGFARCHSSYLINLFYVRKIEKFDMELLTGKKIPISQTKKKQFMESLADYWGKQL